MKRHAPEEPELGTGPLFDRLERGSPASEARIDRDATRAHEHAERDEPGWKVAALAQLTDYASSHEFVIVEDVSAMYGIPEGADKRAWGAVVRQAQATGVLEACDPIRDRWGSWKTRWKSKLCGGAK